jgi:hypothetical protein
MFERRHEQILRDSYKQITKLSNAGLLCRLMYLTFILWVRSNEELRVARFGYIDRGRLLRCVGPHID